MRRRKPVNPAPHAKGSDTSEAAANAIMPAVPSLERKVYEAIVAAGDAGATNRELQEWTRIKHQTVTARCRTLVLKGRVRDSGMRRISRVEKPGKIQVTVWIVGEDANVVEGTLKKAPRRPKEASLKISIHEIKTLVVLARTSGYEPSQDLQDLGAWLDHLARRE